MAGETSVFSWLPTILFGVLLYYLVKLKRGPKNFPPGPWGLPVLGHLPLLGNEAYKTLLEWKKIYGPIIGIRFGSFPGVVISDPKLVREAFSMPEFSGRPQFKVFLEACQGKALVFSDGPLVSEQRQFVLRQLKSFAIGNKELESTIHEELSSGLEDIRVNSKTSTGQPKPVVIGHRFCAPILNAVWSLFMGERFQRGDPKLAKLADGVKALCDMDGILPNIALFVPWLSSLMPNLTKYNSQLNGYKVNYEFAESEFAKPLPPGHIPGQPRNFKEAFKDQMEIHKDNPNSSFHKSHNMFRTIVGDILMASLETTTTTMDWFFIYMALNPHIQEKLYDEIKEVIGTSRLPVLSDRPKCNYAEAVLNEVFRYSALVPLGVSHRATEDVMFHGYLIPKDTLVMANVYGIQHDPEIWGDPQNFRPERFLDENGKSIKSKTDNIFIFSVGKRNCLGEGIARDQLFMYISSFVQKFKISCSDKRPSLSGKPGFAISAKEYELIFTDRLNFN